MSAERDRILKMVEDGAIDAAGAAELLAAIENEAERSGSGEYTPVTPSNPPWEAPFVAGIVLTGFGLLGLMRSRRGNVLGRIGAWVTLIGGLAAAIVGLWSRDVPWLHIKVQESDGNKIHISLPLLLPLAQRILDLARGFVDAETAAQLDNAAAFIEGLQRGERQDPVTVEVDDDDGSKVLIYIA